MNRCDKAGIDGRIVMLLLGGAAILVAHQAGLHNADMAVLEDADVQEAGFGSPSGFVRLGSASTR